MLALAKRIIVPLLIVGVAGGAVAVFRNNQPEKKDQITYEYEPVTRANIRSSVSATGTIQPWKVVDVKSNVAGRIDRLLVDLGDRVEANQLIALIDPTDTQAALEQANADLATARARKEQAMTNLAQQKAQTRARIAAAERSVKSAEARLAQATANNRVQPELTTASINQAKAALSSAQKSVSQAERSKQQLEEQLSSLREVTIPLNVETVRANVDQAVASMRTAEAEYQRQRNLLAQGYVAQSEVQAAYARLATAKASVRTVEQRQQTLQRENELAIRELEAKLSEAQLRVEEAQARVGQAQANLRLAEQGNLTQNEVRRYELEAAQAAVEQARAELDAARAEEHQIRVREKELIAADAQISRGSASQHQASINLEYTRIVAPRGGIVITKNVEEGTVVPSSRASIGSTNALLQIGDTSRLWVVCNVDETDIAQVRVGQKVEVTVDAYPGEPIEGKVIRIDPQARLEQNVTLVPVTVEIAKSDERFKPAMNATCEFIVDEARDVVAIPEEALRERKGAFHVLVKSTETPEPKETPIEVGISGDGMTEVRSGVEAGQEVVIREIKPEVAAADNPLDPFRRFNRNRNNNRGGQGQGGGGNRGGAPRGGGGR